MNHHPSDDDLVAEMLPAFIEEANEQVAAFEQLLLELEDAPDDHERLDALFRCAHTVKGSAGLFGLDRVVAFTHHVETLLDRLRDGLLTLTPALSTLLLQSNDTIRTLVATAQLPEDEASVAARQALVLQLQQACQADPAAGGGAGPAASSAASASTAAAGAGPAASATHWRLSVGFGPEVFRNGMDPLAIFQYLSDLGRLEAVRCEIGQVPELEHLDAETCHLTLHADLISATDQPLPREQIDHAFEFVREDCTLQIEALGSPRPRRDRARPPSRPRSPGRPRSRSRPPSPSCASWSRHPPPRRPRPRTAPPPNPRRGPATRAATSACTPTGSTR